MVVKYLESIASSKINFVELGLRNFPQEKYLGPFAYTTDKYLNDILLPDGPEYGVMVDAKTILSSEHSIEDAVCLLFNPSEQSKISLVRIAAHLHEVKSCEIIINTLKNLGYKVGLNIMQAGGKSQDLLEKIAIKVSKFDSLDVLYFADSLGNMDEIEVKRISTILKKYWIRDMGIHTHDNMNKGLQNSFAAINNGINWVDSTITGMGRGAGNTQTEKLLTELNKLGHNFNLKRIYELVISTFEPMMKKYGWGSNLVYFICAENNIHPTFAQNMLSDKKVSRESMLKSLEFLSSEEEPNKYSDKKYNDAVNFQNHLDYVHGNNDMSGLFDNKKVLVIANSESTKNYKRDIELMIRSNEFVVFSVNINEYIDKNLIDFTVISHNTRFYLDKDNYESISNKVIMPLHRFSQEEISLLKNAEEIYDVSFYVNNNNKITGNSVHINYDLTFAYLLSLLSNSKINEIVLCGFDGYEDSNDLRQKEMIKFLYEYQNFSSNKIKSLTKTSYPIHTSSIYEYI